MFKKSTTAILAGLVLAVFCISVGNAADMLPVVAHTVTASPDITLGAILAAGLLGKIEVVGMSIADLLKARRTALTAAKALVDKAEAEKRELTAAEQKTCDEHLADADTAAAEIEKRDIQVGSTDAKTLRADAIKDENERVQAIRDMAKRHSLSEEFVDQHIKGGTKLKKVREAALDFLHDNAASRAITGTVEAPYVRSPEKAKDPEKGIIAARMVRALAASHGNPDRALSLARGWKDDQLVRALGQGTGLGGGFLVPDIFASEIIELLRPAAVVRSLNPVVMPMPGGNLHIPKLTTGATVGYVGENANTNATQEQFGMVVATSKKLLAIVPVSNDLLKFSSPAADAVIRDDMVAQLVVAEDSAFIRGSGTAFTPKGLRNWLQSGQTVSSTGSTLAQITTDVTGMISKLKGANVRMIRPAWIMSPRSMIAIMALQSTTGNFVYRDEMVKGTFWGYPFKVTTNVPINLSGTNSEIYLVDMADVVIAEVPGLEIEVSREAAYVDSTGTLTGAFTQDQTLVRIIERHDLVMRHDESISVMTGVSY